MYSIYYQRIYIFIKRKNFTQPKPLYYLFLGCFIEEGTDSTKFEFTTFVIFYCYNIHILKTNILDIYVFKMRLLEF